MITGEHLYEAKLATGKSRTQLAKEYGLSEGQVGGLIWRHQQYLKKLMEKPRPEIFAVTEYGEPLHLEGNWTVVSDVHAPTVRYDIASLVIPVSKYYGTRNLIIAGDLMNFDWKSHWPSSVTRPKAMAEIAAAAELLSEWSSYFRNIVYMPGNHEDWWLRNENGNMDLRNLFDIVMGNMPTRRRKAEFEVSNFDHCYLRSGSEDWFILHGTSYGTNPLTVANQIAEKYQTHVIMGHEHHLGKTFDKWGRYVIINNGGLFDQSQMAYATMRANKMATMKNGFSIVIDGVGEIFGPEAFTSYRRIFDRLHIA